MYDNIGKKIKGLAIATFIIEAVASVIAGFIFALEGEDFGAFLLLLGPFAAWLSSWLLYGFGELVDKVMDIEGKFHKDQNAANITEASDATNRNVPTEACSLCGNQTETTHVKIIDQAGGIRYQNLCNDCINKEKQEGNVIMKHQV